jgi:hypothetical protein
MGKTVYVGLAALALWGAGANAHAASPVVIAEHGLCWPTSHFAGDVTTSPNGVAIFRWSTFDGGVFDGAVAVMKNADEPYVTYSVITAALNEDWSKIAIGRELEVFDPRGADTVFVDDIERVARGIGVQPEEVTAALYSDEMVGFLLVSQPVIVDLETRVETPLPVAGSDFLYWLNDDELVIGHMKNGVLDLTQGSREAIKYDVRSGEWEAFPWEDVEPFVSEQRPYGHPYTSKGWRPLDAEIIRNRQYEHELNEPKDPAPPVAVPSRGGRFESDEETIYWVPAAGGPKVKVAAGIPLAASDDGVWLLVMRFTRIYDSPTPKDLLYGLRLAWQ